MTTPYHAKYFAHEMSLKTTILDTLTRDDIERILDDHGVDGVDRRSVAGMRKGVTDSGWKGCRRRQTGRLLANR